MEHRQFKLAALALVGLMAAAPLAAADSTEGGLDVQTSLENLRSSLGSMAVDVNDLKAAQADAVQWGINTDMRYDRQIWDGGSFATGQFVAGNNNGYGGTEGLYAKRVELEATGKMSSWAVWNLQFEFVGLKLEDLGVDAKGLDLLPYVPVKGYNWEAKVGLYRQPFGIENQQGSSAIPFPERALINGGASPVKFTDYETKLVQGNGGLKMVYERVFGVQLIQDHSYGPVGYKLQVAVADDDQDMPSGYAGGAGATGAGSLGIKTNQDPSEFGRLGVDLNFVPGVKLNVGASAMHNPTSTKFDGNTSAFLTTWQDTTGADFTLAVPMAETTIWGEWVGQNTYLGKDSVSGPGLLTSGNYHSEGWYVVDTMKPLAFFNKDWSNVELSGRVENDVPDVFLQGANPAGYQTSEQAATVGLKYLYKGKNYTSVNYTTYALNGNYNALGGSDLFSVQQQFNF